MIQLALHQHNLAGLIEVGDGDDGFVVVAGMLMVLRKR
jgi:hypothetical protein